MRSLKEKRRLDRRLTAILTGMFFFLSFSLFSRVGSWKLEPEKSASDETTQRCVRAQKVINSGWLNEPRKTMDRKMGKAKHARLQQWMEWKYNFSAMVSWYCIKLCEPRHISTLLRYSKEINRDQLKLDGKWITWFYSSVRTSFSHWNSGKSFTRSLFIN